jgi:hypothetical protein
MKPAMVTITRENNTRIEKAEYISISFLGKGKNVLSSSLESFQGGQEGDKNSLQSIKKVLRRLGAEHGGGLSTDTSGKAPEEGCGVYVGTPHPMPLKPAPGLPP